LLQRETFVVPWGLLNWNVQNNVLFFPNFVVWKFWQFLENNWQLFFDIYIIQMKASNVSWQFL
jgi:hypothetical protein